MRKRLLSVLLLLALVMTMLPIGVQAAGVRTPIYLGYAGVDYMAEEILKEIPTAGRSAQEQIRAVYDWIIANCSRYDWDGTYHFDADTVEAQAGGEFYDRMKSDLDKGRIVLRRELEIEAGVNSGGGMFLSYDSNEYLAAFANEMMLTRTGNCAHYSALLAVLLGHLGFDCRLIPGEFVNNDGSAVEHKWNYVLVDGQWYWLDVRIDQSTGSHLYFMETSTETWDSSHDWDKTYSDWLSANAAFVAELYGQDLTDAVGPWGLCSDWAYEYMQRAGEAGLIPERLSGRDLSQGITRAEFSAVAVRLYEAFKGSVPAYIGENPFSDTEEEDVLRAYGLGIVNGVGSGRFAPEATLTREQAVTMLGRVYEMAETGAVSGGATLEAPDCAFPDHGSIGGYAKPYVNFFVDQGIVNGMSGGIFGPLVTMTREQAIKVAVEAAERLG